MTKYSKEYRKQINKNLRQKTNIYISCEGKTEKTYFESLNSIYKNVYIKAKYNKKTSAKDVVNNFATLFKNDDIDDNDLKFCAFDKDNNSDKQLEQATKLATRNNIRILFSNPCFEIWLYWHFENSRSPKTSSELKNYFLYKDNFQNYVSDSFLAKKLESKIQQAKTISQNVEITYKRDDINIYTNDGNPYNSIHTLITCILQI